jgi:predicted outer membrane protein
MTSMTELDHPITAMQVAGAGGADMQAMIERLGTTMQSTNSSQNAIRAMAELAKGIDGLVKHMRTEQDTLRSHIAEQSENNAKLRELIDEMLATLKGDQK